ncbi:hypothetical protein Z517_07843 [Fonsecaea pedrosoi CBS 271.37]|uniref:Uncharacterized protein n=1 Tax=Fonsecaea pedrosoi CBS 271.37 TaxID=1442368 RepID=A0A0D2GHK7_9EURO|nr:uncharacterized protein Z517_07843 [Fonsecaea pedrosoi CBS 271.37]KIW78010.1 hypothetical protein Z517_07843 [Fonsecaea pedrosoi CBS 271.37]
MPLPTTGDYALSAQDVVSFAFGKPDYDLDRPVFIDATDPSHSLSYRQAKDLVQKLIAGFHAEGLNVGDRVCIHAYNSIYYPIICLAIVGCGGVSVGTNPTYTSHELAHALKLARPRFVVTESEAAPSLQKALSSTGRSKTTPVFLLNAPAGIGGDNGGQHSPRSWQTLLNHGSRPWKTFQDRTTAIETTACLFYTSGTTGQPKCAMTSHHNLVAEHQLFYERNPRRYPFRAVLSMPFFHIGVLPTVLISQLREGRHCYIMRRFELEPFLAYHARYDVTEAFLVPPMILRIVMSGLSDPASPNYKYSLRSVKNGYSGAAPCSPEVLKRFQSLLAKGATMSQIWGMTETTSVATTVPSDLLSAAAAGQIDVAGTVGTALPTLTLKLVDEQGEDVSNGGRGQLCVKGPTVTQGYFENENATRESFDSDGYFHTGDVIEVDVKSGLLSVVDRAKELIKVRGFQVAPAELESTLLSHPNIVDAGVVGVKLSDENQEEEVPRAYVVRRDGVDAAQMLTEEDVQAFVRARLASYKALAGGVQFVDALPKLANGKILRRVLREWEAATRRAATSSKL